MIADRAAPAERAAPDPTGEGRCARGGRPPRGLGLYLRGSICQIHARRPAALTTKLHRASFRFSTGRMSVAEAMEAAALLRAALARGFAIIGSWSGADMPSAAENERILTHLARQALSEAEALRALRGPRDETAILAASARQRAPGSYSTPRP